MTYEQELEIIKKKREGFSNRQIMTEYSIKSVKTIYDIIKRNGIKKVGNKKYFVDEKYFQNIDSEEKAYWLGFLFADGYVRMKNSRSGELKLKLSSKDKHHIELFNKCLSSNYKIKDSISKVEKNNKVSISNVASLSIYNTNMVGDLIKLGCTNNKTFSIRFPKIDKSLNRHFIRGYFDGDGNIYKNINRPNSFSITIASNLKFIEDIKKEIGVGSIIEHGNIFLLSIRKIKEVKFLHDYMYCESNIFLKRKKDIFDKIKNKI